MQTFTANEAKSRFGEFLDRAQRAPVGVLKHDRLVGVLVSAEDFEAMRRFYADRLSAMNESEARAEHVDAALNAAGWAWSRAVRSGASSTSRRGAWASSIRKSCSRC